MTATVTTAGTTHGTREVSCWPTLGVDPGARHTGLCVRVLDVVLDAVTVDHGDADGQETVDGDRAYLRAVLDGVTWLTELHQPEATRLMRAAYPDELDEEYPIAVAVEGVNKPSAWHQGKKAPVSPKVGWNVARTMLVYGAVLASFPSAVVVPPGGNGELDRATNGGTGAQAAYYPPELRRVRPARFTSSAYKGREHERSAYDVAGRAQEG